MSPSIKLKPYSVKELSAIYEVNEQTFRNWLIPFKEELGERRGNFYTVNQVELIFKKLGVPKML